MKVREQRKHNFNENSKRKLSSELLAFTMGVSLCFKKTTAVQKVIDTPSNEKVSRTLPMTSSNERYSVDFKTHTSLCVFGQRSSGHLKQLTKSVNNMHCNYWLCIV